MFTEFSPYDDQRAHSAATFEQDKFPATTFEQQVSAPNDKLSYTWQVPEYHMLELSRTMLLVTHRENSCDCSINDAQTVGWLNT